MNEDLIPSKEALALGARRFRAGKIARNWTFQGEVYIALRNDPTPIKITIENDFPESTALGEGEGMLPKEVPLRNRGQQPYQGGARNDIQRQRPSQDVKNNNYTGAYNQNIRAGNTVGQTTQLQTNMNKQQMSPAYRNQSGQQGPQLQQQITPQVQTTAPYPDNRQTTCHRAIFPTRASNNGKDYLLQ